MNKYIKIEDNSILSNSEYNYISVSTIYKKGDWLYWYIQEWKYVEEDTGYVSFSYDLYGSKSVRIPLVQMSRKSQKKIDTATEEFFSNSDNYFIELIKNVW